MGQRVYQKIFQLFMTICLMLTIREAGFQLEGLILIPLV